MEEKTLTVEALSKYIKLKFDTDNLLKNIRLKAEIADVNSRRGIYYLKLKDEHAVISAVIFTEYVTDTISQFKIGDEIEVYGDVNVFIKNGSYQFYIREADLAGVGLFYRQFKEVQKKLYNEGLFAQEHKKEIPSFPQKIALVTASNSAALQDLLVTLGKRFPIAQPLFFSAPMQGKHAVDEIIRQLQNADISGADVIVLARGGGSYEDLVVFNDEQLARTIYGLQTPIITGIGHEIDTTIADFVADLRAATPTAAIEHAVPDKVVLMQHIASYRQRLDYLVDLKIKQKEQLYSNVREKMQRLSPEILLKKERESLDTILKRYMQPLLVTMYFTKKKDEILQQAKNITTITASQIQTKKEQLEKVHAILDKIGPLQVLARGYAYVEKDNAVISSVQDLAGKDVIQVHFTDGFVDCEVKDLKINE